MKKKYTKADMEIIAFDTEDVIMTSSKGMGEDGETTGDDGTPP